MNRTGKGLSKVVVLMGLVIFAGVLFSGLLGGDGFAAKEDNKAETAELRKGKNYIQTKVYTQKEDEEVLKLFEGLRVTDVTDGMDKAGLNNIGLMSPEIMPLWKDTKHFTHRCIGVAVTVRYVPTNEPPPTGMNTEQFNEWVGRVYNDITPEPFVDIIRKGTMLVFDDAESMDVGTIGSNNIMGWHLKGCVGVVTDQTARDTDEIIAEGIPLYFRKVGRGIRPGRNEVESVNRPIECGGVLVEPGDVIIADGDGVLVVPRAKAPEVAAYASATLNTDKNQRRNLYDQLGLEKDDSVR